MFRQKVEGTARRRAVNARGTAPRTPSRRRIARDESGRSMILRPVWFELTRDLAFLVNSRMPAGLMAFKRRIRVKGSFDCGPRIQDLRGLRATDFAASGPNYHRRSAINCGVRRSSTEDRGREPCSRVGKKPTRCRTTLAPGTDRGHR
jgi:hypothetical protein